MYYTYKLVNKATAEVIYTNAALEDGNVLKLENGTEVHFEGEGENLTNEEYTLEKFEKYVVTQENLDDNKFFATLGIPVGAEVEYDPAVVISREEAIAQGIDVEKVEKEAEEAEALKKKEAEEAEAKKKADEEEEAKKSAGVVTAPKEPKRFYEKKLIVAEYPREVNGKTYHHVRLADGSTQDLTDEQKELIVIEK